MNISYDSTELIDELAGDIAEFGPDLGVVAIKEEVRPGLYFITDYDFLEVNGDIPADIFGLGELIPMTAKELMQLLQTQDEIL